MESCCASFGDIGIAISVIDQVDQVVKDLQGLLCQLVASVSEGAARVSTRVFNRVDLESNSPMIRFVRTVFEVLFDQVPPWFPVRLRIGLAR